MATDISYVFQQQQQYHCLIVLPQVVRTGLDKGTEEGYKAERDGFGELCATPESKALISLFHGQTECKKNKFGKPAKQAK